MSIGVRAVIRADLMAGQSVARGVDPMSGSALNKSTSDWDITAQIDAAYKHTRQRKLSGASFDATQSAGTTGVIDISHNGPWTPDPEDVSFAVVLDDGAGGATAGPAVAAASMNGYPTSANCSFRWQILSPGSGADQGHISMKIKY